MLLRTGRWSDVALNKFHVIQYNFIKIDTKFTRNTPESKHKVDASENHYVNTFAFTSGSLPVNAHSKVNILNLNYITALYFILLPLYCQIICTTINNQGAWCNICFKPLLVGQ